MSVLHPEEHLKESGAMVCPGCDKHLDDNDMQDVDSDGTTYDLFEFLCMSCHTRFVIKKPINPDEY